MAGVRSRYLVLADDIPVAQTVQYTCPDGETAIAKWLTVNNADSVTRSVTVAILVSGVPFRMWRESVPSATTVNLAIWWVLMPEMQLTTATAAAGVVDVMIFGAELEGVAD